MLRFRPTLVCAQACLALLYGQLGWATGSAERGEYLAAAAGCKSCHTDSENEGTPYAGNHRLETPYGDFYVPNITPDPETGIGNWTDAEFLSALREGISPAGEYYYPAFPYASYAGMTDMDALDIKAYLGSLAPVKQANKAHELSWYLPGRWAMGIWQQLFAPWEYADTPSQASAEWQRGAYLVRHLGHCGECHTPRDSFGALQTQQELSGATGTDEDSEAPDITGDRNRGIGSWSKTELEFFLEMGMYPDGDFAGGDMVAVIDDNTALLAAADRQAIAAFLLSLNSNSSSATNSGIN